MFGPSPVSLGLSGGGVVGCRLLQADRERLWIVQLFSDVKWLILLTCGNITGIVESNPWLAPVALKLILRGKGGGIDPFTCFFPRWSFVLCVSVHLS